MVLTEQQRARISKWKLEHPGRQRELAKRWVERNPEKARRMTLRANLKYMYGMSLEEYDTLLEKQNGQCAICGAKPSERLHVDHNHETGEIRGLLCRFCNNFVVPLVERGQSDLVEKAKMYLGGK